MKQTAYAEVPVCSQEAYLDIADDSLASVMSEFASADRLAQVARIFSKFHAMTGQWIVYSVLPEGMAMDMRRLFCRKLRSHVGGHIAPRKRLIKPTP